ncbi:hypothetical protein [Mycolicibacterium komossense]|uniref:Secreted protein n=1 Tax=Mycolicibacterium komossense TaxID=1779 RepID=A0ABT3CH35_9MYCO|nr:hypothetical protein [Mycolicibacterium komossense]MCV7228754.1 hypothetical protein [Mycolicibacterium komossense]
MTGFETGRRVRGGAMQIPRSRGAASGLLLIVLGVWGALIPFVGPYFDFAYSPAQPWVWTEARGWLEVLPALVAVVGGFLLLTSRNRATAMLGGWLGVIAGAWFVIGRASAQALTIGDIGVPSATTPAKTAVLELAFFSGIGALMIFLAAAAVGRLSIRSLRDIGYAQRFADTGAQPVVVEPEPVLDHEAEEVPRRQRSPRHWGDILRRRHTPIAH